MFDIIRIEHMFVYVNRKFREGGEKGEYFKCNPHVNNDDSMLCYVLLAWGEQRWTKNQRTDLYSYIGSFCNDSCNRAANISVTS